MKDNSVISAQSLEYFGTSYVLAKGEYLAKRIPLNQIATFWVTAGQREKPSDLQNQVNELRMEVKRLSKDNKALRTENEGLKADQEANTRTQKVEKEANTRMDETISTLRLRIQELEGKLRETEAELVKYNPEKSARSLRVLAAEFRKADSMFLRERHLNLTLRNDTGQAISKADFKMTLLRPGRSIPDFEAEFGCEFQGGIEPGEIQSTSLAPNLFLKPEWHSVELYPGMVPMVKVKQVFGKDGMPF
jgi:outer membrane murein-binding lipoprotein Lpp